MQCFNIDVCNRPSRWMLLTGLVAEVFGCSWLMGWLFFDTKGNTGTIDVEYSISIMSEDYCKVGSFDSALLTLAKMEYRILSCFSVLHLCCC